MIPQTCFQSLSVDKLAYEKTDIIFRLPCFIKADDRRMLELSGAAGLAEKSLNILRGSEVTSPLDLERHNSLQTRIPGPEDVPERTDTEF